MCWHLYCFLASVCLLSRSRETFAEPLQTRAALSFGAPRLLPGRRKRACRAATTTDRNGNYVLLELPVGHYRLQAAAKGFQEYVQDGITLNVNETASVSPHLAVGSEKQQVVVSADAAAD